MKTDIYLWYCLAELLWEWYIFQAKVVEKIKTHFMSSITFSRKSCHLWDMWRNMVEPDRPQTTMWGLRFAYSIPTAADPQSEYVMLFSTLQQRFHESASVSRVYLHCLSCFSPKYSNGKDRVTLCSNLQVILGSIILALTDESLYLMIHRMNIHVRT